VGNRDLQKEIKDLEESKKIKILGIETMDGLLTPPVIETAIESLKSTLEHVDLDKIEKSVDKDLKEYSKRGSNRL
jgi:hypothetical protein